MDEKIKQTIRQMFPQLLKENLMSFSNLTIPPHKHNRVDAPAVTMGDLAFDNRGLIFPFSTGKVSIISDLTGIAFANYVSSTDFTLGEADNAQFPGVVPFYDISFNAFNSVGAVVENATNINEFTIHPDQTDNQIAGSGGNSVESLDLITGKVFTATGDFALQLPDTTRPSPGAGMIAFEAGVFYACADGVTWQVINLI